MLHFVYRTLAHGRIKHSSVIFIRYLKTQSASKKSNNLVDKQSLSVNFLTNSCGLSLQSAVSAAKLCVLKSAEKSESVLELLRSYGFSQKQIAALVSKNPQLILNDPDKNLRPKIKYFESLGLVGPDFAKTGHFLHSSLQKRIIPTFDFLKRYIQIDDDLSSSIKLAKYVIRCNIQKVMVPNIDTLKSHGVPESLIGNLLLMNHKLMMVRIDLFKEVAAAVKEMGFDPKTRSFILALRTMLMTTKESWERKKEVLMSFGWSEKDFNAAFKVQPMLMSCSEKKLKELMDYFENEVGLEASDVAKCPNILLTSLEKRIIPRCSVLQILMLRGLIGREVDVVWALNDNKKNFESKFINKFKKAAPEIVKAYKGELKFED